MVRRPARRKTDVVMTATAAEQLADAMLRVHRGLRVFGLALAVESLAVGSSPRPAWGPGPAGATMAR